MFIAFLQGAIAGTIFLGSMILGVVAFASQQFAGGLLIIAIGGTIAAYLRYLSRHTTRIRR